MPGLVRLPGGLLKGGRQLAGVCIAGQAVWRKPVPPRALGGTITTATIDGVGYYVHTFTEDGVFETLEPLDVEYFLVGGGGQGGYRNNGGGGGAGGRVRHNLGAPLALSPGNYPVTVGVGGDAVPSAPGTDSLFSGIRAEGGREGSSGARGPGGSQGGIGGHVGGVGLSTVGNAGGGAGDGEDGGDVLGGQGGGAGGDGSYHNPDGTARYFAGGGGGKSLGPAGAGGATAGSSSYGGQRSLPAIDGTGSGSGGGSSGAGKGGDGIVIIRYRA